MTQRTITLLIVVLLTCALEGSARDSLNNDEMKMLQDPGGWEYVSVSDSDAGVQTTHTCFDGHPHPQECSGMMTLSAGDTFTQNVYIHGTSVQRHGAYKLDDRKISFTDELGTQDGPYTLDLNTQTKHMVLTMAPVRIELELESQYRDDLHAKDLHHQ